LPSAKTRVRAQKAIARSVLRANGVFTGAELPREFHPLDVEIRRFGDGLIDLADDDDMKAQCAIAETFLFEHSAHLLSLGQNPMVEGITLDFGLWQKAVVAQFIDVPASLVSAAGALGIGISASLYLCSDDDET
jgi:hypothetical protein